MTNSVPNDKLRVALLPIDIKIADKAANMAVVGEFMRALPQGYDLVVLPELFSTGYIDTIAQVDELAETVDGTTMQCLRRLAADSGVALCGSYLAADGGCRYNRAFFVEPGGRCTYYDKRHLFCLSREADVVCRGEKPMPVIEYKGWRIAPAVCYDLRFPVWLRNIPVRYDVLVIPANWPVKRAYAWQHLLIARAIENQAYVIGCNRSGSDAYGTYNDMSAVYDYMGKPIGEAKAVGMVAADLDLDALGRWRHGFPVWRDADRL